MKTLQTLIIALLMLAAVPGFAQYTGGCGRGDAMAQKLATCLGGGAASAYYQDSDGDGFGNLSISQTACIQPGGYVANSTDCDDGNAAVNPNTIWYLDADNDNYYTGSGTTQCTTPGAGYRRTGLTAGGDCADGNAAVNPGATEVCGNGLDENCNGSTNDAGASGCSLFYQDTDADAFGNPSQTSCNCTVPSGYVSNNTDCNDGNAAVNPTTVWYLDTDGDNYYSGSGTTQCTSPGANYKYTGLIAGGDCYDNNAARNPGATEVCGNGIDEDCSGSDLACASGITWTGTVSTAWGNANNWNPSTNVPASTDDVIIPTVATPYPVVSGVASFNVKDITIQSGASITINAPATLHVYGNISNSGSSSFGAGDLEFAGSGTQSLTGALSSGGVVSVPGTLTHILQTNGNLTIESGGSLMHGTNTPGGGGYVSGNVTVKRAGHSSPAKWNFWGAPVTGASTNILGNRPNYYNPLIATSPNTVTGLQAGWVPYSGVMTQGVGYISKGGGTVSFTGTVSSLNPGPTITIPVTVNANGVAYNVMGNPFPSAMSALAFVSANAGMIDGGAIYFWDDDGSSGSGYSQNDFATWSGIGSVSQSLNQNSSTIPNDFIASGQGFSVKCTGAGNLIFTNNMRATTNDVFFRQAPIERLWVSITNPVGLYNEVLVAFIDDATDGRDVAYDATKFRGNDNIALYTKLGGEDYAIQALAPLTADKTVTLGFDAGIDGSHTLQLNTIENIDETVTVILEDTETGTFQNLRLNDTYTFTAAAGKHESRFILHFNPAMQVETGDATCAGNDATLTFQQAGSKLWNYTLKNSGGKMLERIAGFNGTNVYTNLSPGSYTLMLTDDYGYQTTKTIELVGKALVTADFTASSQAVNVNEEISFVNLSEGAAVYEWNFGDGTISNEQSPVYTYINAGEYDVSLRSWNDDCEGTSSMKVTVEEDVTGISALSNDVLIFAAGKQIYLNFNDVADVKGQVQVYNTLGQLMLTKEVHTTGKMMIDAGTFASSCYFVKVVSSENMWSQKIFVGE